MKNRTSMPRSGKRETCGLPRVAIRAGSATVEAALGAPPGARPTAALGAALPAGEPPPGRPHGRPAEESRLRQPPGSAPAAPATQPGEGLRASPGGGRRRAGGGRGGEGGWEREEREEGDTQT